MRRRRNIIKPIGVDVFGFAGTASARKSESETSAVEAGIDAEIETLLSRDDLTEAERLLKDHNVRYDLSRTEIPDLGSLNETSSGMVTPDAHYRDGSSEVFSSLVHRYGDVYFATGGVNLVG